MLEVCARFGQADPAWFFAQPGPVQDLWIAHQVNTMTNAYAPKTAGKRAGVREMKRAEADALDAIRKRSTGSARG